MKNKWLFFTIVIVNIWFIYVDKATGNNGYEALDQTPVIVSGQSDKENWNSSILYKGTDGSLIYHSDEEGNRIPDFSYAGYRGGGVPLFQMQVVTTLDPSPTGNDTQQIQQALNEVGALEPDENGHRGAVLLNPGIYYINSRITIQHSGVVLRGSGDGDNPAENTIIHAAKTIGNVSIQVGPGNVNWNYSSGSPISQITTEFVAVGSRHFAVANASVFSVGDDVVIFHRATQQWIEAVEYGGTSSTHPDVWTPSDVNLNIVMKRKITGISDSIIALDVPVYNHLNRSLSESLVYKVNLGGQISESGVEHFRLVLESDGPEANNHGNNAIIFNGVTDSWAYGVTVLHFRFTGIGATNSTFVTIQNSRALEPHSPIDGGYRYNFNVMSRANNILFTDVHASYGRHCFVSNGTATVSGVVFHNGTSHHAYNASEGHRRWSMGLLFDNLIFNEAVTNIVIGLYNRGTYGTNHGWSSAHSVAWNSDPGPEKRIVIQKPPTAQNYGIANREIVHGTGPFAGPAGFIEGTNQTPELTSLYDAQLYDRLTYGVPPDAPAQLRAIPYDENRYLKLEWIHLHLYDIELLIERSVNGGDFEELVRLNSHENSFIDFTVGNDEYRYRMAANDNGRMSAWSNAAGFDMNIPTFDLRSPASGTILELKGDPSQNFNSWWTAIVSDFDFLYNWYLDHADGDFTDPLLEIQTDVNIMQVSYGDLEQILHDEGISMGDTLKGKWMVKATSGSLNIWADDPFSILIVRGGFTTDINGVVDGLQDKLYLHQNFPNPVRHETIISFTLPDTEFVQLSVYNIKGQEVKRLIYGTLSAGEHSVSWNTSSHYSGLYIYRIIASTGSKSRIMTVIK
jgi:hypothetical protein